MLLYVLFFFGLVLLIFGSNLLIRSLLALSHFLQVKPLHLSIVVLGFVTSSAELFVTFIAAYEGASELAVSNVIGSNTINILLVLGSVGLIYSIKQVDLQIVKFDLPCLLGFLIFLALLSYDGSLSLIDCLFSLLVFLTYIYFLFKTQKQKKVSEDVYEDSVGLVASLRDLVIGFVGLFTGSHLMIDNSMEIGSALGLSEAFIGFFVLALGTSLPELATSIIAALKKEGEMILGNIIGSNIFNTLFIIGSAGLLQPLSVSSNLHRDYFFMFTISLCLWIVLVIFKGIPKTVSILFLITYLIYIYLLFDQMTLTI